MLFVLISPEMNTREKDISRLNKLIEKEISRYAESLDRKDPYPFRNDILKRLKVLKSEIAAFKKSPAG